MSATTQRDALAADLLADMATEPKSPTASTSGPSTAPRRRQAPRPSPDPVPGVVAEPPATGGRGPALQSMLRFRPFDWHRPKLVLEPRLVGVDFGPLSARVEWRQTRVSDDF